MFLKSNFRLEIQRAIKIEVFFKLKDWLLTMDLKKYGNKNFFNRLTYYN